MSCMAESRNRGKVKPKLRDLSKAIPTKEQADALSREVYTAHPIAAAIIGTAMVEHELDTLLRRKIKPNDDAWNGLTDDNGPLGTFSRKITMGRALDLYDNATEQNLNTIRAIRNAFAHTRILIDFDHELVTKEIKNIVIQSDHDDWHLEFISEVKNGRLNSKDAFGLFCMTLSTSLLRRQTKLSESPFYSPLAGLIGGFGPLPPPGDEPTNWLRWYRLNHNVDPRSPVRTTEGGASIPPLDPDDHNEDKK